VVDGLKGGFDKVIEYLIPAILSGYFESLPIQQWRMAAPAMTPVLQKLVLTGPCGPIFSHDFVRNRIINEGT
jgi:hypothetical protein